MTLNKIKVSIGEYKMKLYFAILLICISSFGHTAVSIWPDSSAPCNGTLQACINASNEGDTVEIHTNSPVNEDLIVHVALSVVAGIGYSPVFTSGNSLRINTTSSGGAISVAVKGLTFEQGLISVRITSRPLIIYIENNAILENIPDFPAVYISSTNIALSESVIHVNYNNIKIDSSNSSSAPISAITIIKGLESTGPLSGELTNNTLDLAGLDTIGINISVNNDSDLSLDIIGNEIYGGSFSGINARRNFSTGTTELNIVSNAFYQKSPIINSSGISIRNDSGATNVNIINNTKINGSFGVKLTENSGTLTAKVHSNIVAFTTQGFDFGSGVAVNNDYNLYYQNASSIGFTPGAHSINADPKIMGWQNARLRPGSPALESGNLLGLLLVAGAPLIDADGLLRVKNSSNVGPGVIDIGAYEAGDTSIYHVNTSTSGHITTIDNPITNNLVNLDSLHITYNANPEYADFTNNDNEGLYYSSGFWRIFNENIVSLPTGASFNVSKFASTNNTFEHLVTSSGASSSTINKQGLDGAPQKILQLSQHWINVYNISPPGLIYIAGHWRIVNFDLNNIPIGSNFNVYYQDKSKSAYEHIAKSSNISDNTFTYLDNPIINGVSCAQIQVTQSASQSVFNNSPIGVVYNKVIGRWEIFNQNTSVNMPVNATFHVLINPAQIAECMDVIFKDDFE